MSNTLTQTFPNSAEFSGEQAPQFTYREKKIEIHPDGPNNLRFEPQTIDNEREIAAHTAIAKEVAASIHPEVEAVSDRERYNSTIDHAAVRVEVFRRDKLLSGE